MRARGLLAAVLLLIAVVAALSWINARRFSTANGLVVHTQEVARQLEAVNVALVSVESATRAYALTGNAAFVSSARQFEGDARLRLSDVRGLTADNPTQQALVAELGQAVDEKVAFNEEIVPVRDRAGLAAAAALVGSRRGSQAMSRIRGIIGDMRGNEEHLLHVRTGELARLRLHTTCWAASSSGCSRSPSSPSSASPPAGSSSAARTKAPAWALPSAARS